MDNLTSPNSPNQESGKQPQSSDTPLVSEQERPIKRKYLQLGIILLFLVLIGLAGIYWYSRQNKVENSTQQSQQSNTSTVIGDNRQLLNYKTYTNTQYDYTFEYPDDYTVNENNGQVTVTATADLTSGGHEFGSINISVANGQDIYAIADAKVKQVGKNLVSNKTISFAGKYAVEISYGSDIGADYKNIIVAGNPILDIEVGGYDPNFDAILKTFKFVTPPVVSKSEQQIKAGQRKQYVSQSFGISFTYNVEAYTAPQVIQEENPNYNSTKTSIIVLGDNIFPQDFATAKAYVRIYKEAGRPADFINQEVKSLPKYEEGIGGCKILDNNSVDGQPSVHYQCSELGDTHTVLIKHPDGSFIRVQGAFAGNDYLELVKSIKFIR